NFKCPAFGHNKRINDMDIVGGNEEFEIHLGQASSYGEKPQLVERSEEHTSELQSCENLVCRLLLEKKNPMNGSVVRVLVQPGQQVEAGTALMVLEAMKMEHSVRADRSGTVRLLFVGEVDMVTEGSL